MSQIDTGTTRIRKHKHFCRLMRGVWKMQRTSRTFLRCKTFLAIYNTDNAVTLGTVFKQVKSEPTKRELSPC